MLNDNYNFFFSSFSTSTLNIVKIGEKDFICIWKGIFVSVLSNSQINFHKSRVDLDEQLRFSIHWFENPNNNYF